MNDQYGITETRSVSPGNSLVQFYCLSCNSRAFVVPFIDLQIGCCKLQRQECHSINHKSQAERPPPTINFILWKKKVKYCIENREFCNSIWCTLNCGDCTCCHFISSLCKFMEGLRAAGMREEICSFAILTSEQWIIACFLHVCNHRNSFMYYHTMIALFKIAN